MYKMIMSMARTNLFDLTELLTYVYAHMLTLCTIEEILTV
jgi:hypothetical protein